MLKKLSTILLSFVAISIITSTFEVSDGYDIIGYPFVFYQNLGGKCFDCANKDFFKIHYLILDFAIVSNVVLLLFFLYEKMK
jgi:quinol-cytochrome oxidoreductase complex cytochrome b subunit